MTLNERAELIVHDIKMETETNPIRIFKNIAKKNISVFMDRNIISWMEPVCLQLIEMQAVI